MKHVYQLVLLGEKITHIKSIVESFFEQTKYLGIENEFISIIEADNFCNYQPNNPTYCLYFTSSDTLKDHDIIDTLIKDATLILPVIEDLKKCTEQIPESLQSINAFELASTLRINALVSRILEGFNLLRASRRLFISYRRNETSSAAIQLYEALEQSGFDVFLDTHSIRPGEPFQEELWHRMSDSDVVILLNSPDFLGSNWTQEELTKANAMSIGVIQLDWPNCNPLPGSNLFKTINLKDQDLTENGCLKAPIANQIISHTESLRARTLAARRDNLTTEFINICKTSKVETKLHPYKFITLEMQNKHYLIIPAVGVPNSLTSHDIYELKQKIRKNCVEKIFLLYDHTNIREKWLNHLDWLKEYLPVKTLTLLETEAFISSELLGK